MEAARATQCASNLKQIQLALLNYHGTFKIFPPGTAGPDSGWSWSALILPYLEEQAAHNLVDFDFGYNTRENQEAIKNFFVWAGLMVIVASSKLALPVMIPLEKNQVSIKILTQTVALGS